MLKIFQQTLVADKIYFFGVFSSRRHSDLVNQNWKLLPTYLHLKQIEFIDVSNSSIIDFDWATQTSFTVSQEDTWTRADEVASTSEQFLEEFGESTSATGLGGEEIETISDADKDYVSSIRKRITANLFLSTTEKEALGLVATRTAFEFTTTSYAATSEQAISISSRRALNTTPKLMMPLFKLDGLTVDESIQFKKNFKFSPLLVQVVDLG